MGSRGSVNPANCCRRTASAAFERAAAVADELAEAWEGLPRDSQVAREVAEAIREHATESNEANRSPAPHRGSERKDVR